MASLIASRREAEAAAVETPATKPRTRDVAIAGGISAVTALLVYFGIQIPFGWTLVLAATLGLPAIGLARMFSIDGDGFLAALTAVPIAFGVQLPLFAVASVMHWSPRLWGVLAIAIGISFFGVGMIRNPEPRDRPHLPRIQAATLIALIVAAAVFVSLSGRDSDDWSYGAFVADIAANKPLMASDPVLGDDIEVFPRQQFNLWLGVLGVASRVSSVSVPGLLQDQLPPLMAAVALLATYLLGRALGGRPAWGISAVAIQLGWYSALPNHSEPGHAFLQRITEDKFVAWLILVPLILTVLLHARRWPLRRWAVFGVLAGLGLAAVHPVSYFLAIIAIGSWLILAVVTRSTWSWKHLAVATAGLLVATVIPALVWIGISNIGPEAGSEAAAAIEQQQVITNQGRLWLDGSNNVVMVRLEVIKDPMTLAMTALAVSALLLARTRATTLVGAMALATIALAFNPILTPIAGSLIGVGQLWRLTWLLPIPFAIAAVGGAYVERFGERLPLAPLLAVFLVAGMQLAQVQDALADWQDNRTGWREVSTLVPVLEALDGVVAPGEYVLAERASVEVFIPSYAPDADLVAFRGPLGTRSHFPRERLDEAIQRETLAEEFFAVDYLTGSLLRRLDTFDVGYVVTTASDPKAVELVQIGWHVLAGNEEWVALARTA